MTGGALAVHSGAQLRDAVAALGLSLGLDARIEVRVGRRLWGAVRRIDVVLRDPGSRLSLGIECKYQDSRGSAEEKIPATIEDIRAWPIRGLVVFAGAGFTENMKAFLVASGFAVDMEDLESWLRLYFGI